MMLLISIPKCCEVEQRYILEVVLDDFLGLKYIVQTHEKSSICIAREGSQRKICIDSTFFLKAECAWLKPESMPKLPLMSLDVRSMGLNLESFTKTVPVLFGKPRLKKKPMSYELDVDIFGSIFFMLSRYEELVTKEHDKYGRFTAVSSIAFKGSFIDTPVVDQYVEILWACLVRLWPNLTRKKIKAKNFITCDVDWPFDPALNSFKKMLRQSVVQLIKNKDILSALKTPAYYLLNKLGCQVVDKNEEAINWIMDSNEKAGNIVAFYFITYNTSHLDTDEDLDSARFRLLIQKISRRGHEIGLHPGYETFDNAENFAMSVRKLKQILKEENIVQPKLGGRQHFLRWDSSQTPHLWEKHGFSYDSTLAFADCAGFRCGTSKEYTMYNLVDRCQFKLKQRPLITMECSIISDRYEGLGYTKKAVERFDYFKNEAYKYQGSYTLLWHNSHFLNDEDKVFYQRLIK